MRIMTVEKFIEYYFGCGYVMNMKADGSDNDRKMLKTKIKFCIIKE